MIKRTLYLSTPVYLSTRLHQLEIKFIDSGEFKTIPIEDIGILIIDHQQVTFTQALLNKLLENGTAVIGCGDTHHPNGLWFPLEGNHLQSLKYKYQIEASIPLKKQLWQQTVVAKIENQAALLSLERVENKTLLKYASEVKSGDAENNEAKAAAYYWKNVFPDFLDFKRDRYGLPPNNLLNYGYAILRAMTARSLTISGLLPTLGIHHKNQYNAYCLADDIMEPYRPFVDKIVCKIIKFNGKYLEMTPNMKKELLALPQMDVVISNNKSPMLNAIQKTTASLAKCFEGKSRKILYPTLIE